MIEALAGSQAWVEINKTGQERDCASEARNAYVGRVLSFLNVSAVKPFKS